MAEDTTGVEEQAREETVRERRLNDWTLRQLGEGWRRGEPGIYYPPGMRPPHTVAGRHNEAAAGEHGESLDADLRDRLPDRSVEDSAYEDPVRPL